MSRRSKATAWCLLGVDLVENEESKDKSCVFFISSLQKFQLICINCRSVSTKTRFLVHMYLVAWFFSRLQLEVGRLCDGSSHIYGNVKMCRVMWELGDLNYVIRFEIYLWYVKIIIKVCTFQSILDSICAVHCASTHWQGAMLEYGSSPCLVPSFKLLCF